jgi:hypothetical protein
LAKLSAGDVTVIDAQYHTLCLVGLCSRMPRVRDSDHGELTEDTDVNVNLLCSQFDNSVQMKSYEAHIHGTAFAQLAAYIEKVQLDAVTLLVFK